MQEESSIQLFTNSVQRKDFIRNIFTNSSLKDMEINIASAFFTDCDLIKQLVSQNNKINLVIRLCAPTTPDALKKIINLENVSVRFFTSAKFHPKLYLFKNFAVFGSANLTNSGLMTNQEIVAKINSAHPTYHELEKIFEEYWSSANVLTENILGTYKNFYDSTPKPTEESFSAKLEEIIGKVEFANLTVDINQTKDNIKDKIAIFRKNYDNCRHSLLDLQKIYLSFGKRRKDFLPVKIEIDSFLSWIRDTEIPQDKWKTVIHIDKNLYLEELFHRWIKSEYKPLEYTSEKFTYVNKLFSTRESILDANFEIIAETLFYLHSVNSRKRYFKDGKTGFIENFIDKNNESAVKNSFIYLFSKNTNPDIIERMYYLIYDKKYKIKDFGESNIQELVGWVCDDFLIINGRTTKVLHHLGYKIRQL